MTTSYFTSSAYTPPALLRRTEYVDEVFVNGAWQPTQAISRWQVGEDNSVEPVSREQARAFAPEASPTDETSRGRGCGVIAPRDSPTR